MIEYGLKKRFDMAHELGGVPSWSLTRELYEKARGKLIVGRRPVPEKLLAKARAGILPPKDPPRPPLDVLAATRSMSDPTGSVLLSRRAALDGKSKKEKNHA